MTQTIENQVALEYLQIIPSDILAQVCRGELNLNELAKLELSYRGQDTNGKWVGFNQAAKIHQITI